MDRFLAMRVFVEVADAGSFSRAAEKLDISTTAASRHVAQLERHLGTRLLQRTTRHLALTEVGQRYLLNCRDLLERLSEADAEAGLANARPAGLLRVSLPHTFGARYVAPELPAFRREYPDIRLELDFSDRLVDMVEEGFDLALRISRRLPADAVARRLSPIRMVVCAAPAYLAARGTPQSPDELASHDLLAYSLIQGNDSWQLLSAAGSVSVPQHGPLRANNGEVLNTLAIAGGGVIFQPTFLCGDALRAGSLRRILPDWQGDAAMALYAVYPSRRFLPAKTRVLIDYLAARFGEVPPWDRDLGW